MTVDYEGTYEDWLAANHHADVARPLRFLDREQGIEPDGLSTRVEFPGWPVAGRPERFVRVEA